MCTVQMYWFTRLNVSIHDIVVCMEVILLTSLYDLVSGTWRLLGRMAISISGSGYQIQKHSGIIVYTCMK